MTKHIGMMQLKLEIIVVEPRDSIVLKVRNAIPRDWKIDFRRLSRLQCRETQVLQACNMTNRRSIFEQRSLWCVAHSEDYWGSGRLAFGSHGANMLYHVVSVQAIEMNPLKQAGVLAAFHGSMAGLPDRLVTMKAS